MLKHINKKNLIQRTTTNNEQALLKALKQKYTHNQRHPKKHQNAFLNASTSNTKQKHIHTNIHKTQIPHIKTQKNKYISKTKPTTHINKKHNKTINKPIKKTHINTKPINNAQKQKAMNTRPKQNNTHPNSSKNTSINKHPLQVKKLIQYTNKPNHSNKDITTTQQTTNITIIKKNKHIN